MLRITTHDNSGRLTFQLEGKLAGPWVQELEACWRKKIAGLRQPVVYVDLTGVTFIDAAGKEFLAALHVYGAQFVAAGCAMKAILAEVTGTPLYGRDCPGQEQPA